YRANITRWHKFRSSVRALPRRTPVTLRPNVYLQRCIRWSNVLYAGEGGDIMSAATLLIILLVGLIAGWLAGQIVKGTGFGLIADIALGICGATPPARSLLLRRRFQPLDGT